MDEQSKAMFDEIVVKEPVALTETEIDFLRARRSYLTKAQEEVFADVLATIPKETTIQKAAKVQLEDTESPTPLEESAISPKNAKGARKE